MKFAFAAIAFVAGVYAQTINDIPACALPGIDAARKKATSCAENDFKCTCQNVEVLTQAATEDILKACGPDVAANQVLPAVQKLCANVATGGSGGTVASMTAPPTMTTSAASTSGGSNYTTSASASTTSKPAPVSSAGAAVVGSIGSLGMVVLGALAVL